MSNTAKISNSLVSGPKPVISESVPLQMLFLRSIEWR
jgi:hypothetical protein